MVSTSYSLTPQTLSLLASISERLGEVRAAHLHHPSPLLKRAHRVSNIHATLALEDNPLDRRSIAELLDGPHVGPAGDIPAVQAFGAGAGLYREVMENAGATVDPLFAQAQPTAVELGRAAARRIIAAGSLAEAGLLDSTPLYLRESDAKVPGPRKRAL